IAFCAMAAMIGLQFSLTSKKTVQAVMISTSIVLGACGLLTLCGFAISQQSAEVGAVVLPFTPFPAMQALIDPVSLFGAGSPTASAQAQVRIIRIITSLISAAIYLGITFSLYKNMVRGFDMIVRRQSA
ncbi:MAG: hypothetical protein JXO22_08050, partial [Phycisphaerae bacterium]|nr:hypothetical protein [Phycisphaerae bacterium]